MSCGVGHRHGLDSALLAPIRPLAWELPSGVAAALKSKKKKKKAIIILLSISSFMSVNIEFIYLDAPLLS